MMTKVPVVAVVDNVLTVLTVGIVKGVDEAVVAVVGDSVVNVVGVVVLSVTHTYRQFHYQP